MSKIIYIIDITKNNVVDALYVLLILVLKTTQVSLFVITN